MRAKFYSLLGLLFFGGAMMAQTIVSTNPENKKVILEEFTGINCVFCPDGHAIAKAIQDANPGNVFLINIHTGGFANPSGSQPDYRTPFGSAIANQSGLVGYPAGTVNRTLFPGQSQSGGNDTAMSRGQWASASNQTLGQASYLNMAVEAEIDVAASEIEVHVEAYYTGDSPEATNKLNVALLQNNTLGPQTGGNQGNNYVHMHRLVWMLTGQWGEDINTTSQDDFVDRTYTYTIPSNYNGIPVVLEDLEVVVFMTETTQDVISGNGAFPSYVNLPLDDDASVEADEDIVDQCGVDFGPTVTIQNRGNNALTSLDIDYSINGGATETFTWNGNLGPFETEEVLLDAIPYTIQSNNTIDISIPNDDDNTNNDTSNTFDDITDENTSVLSLRMSLDENGDEVTWVIVNSNGDTVESGGPYGANEEVDETFEIPDIDCYRFVLTDSGNDGQYFVRLRDSDNDIMALNASSSFFGTNVIGNFRLNGVLSVGDNALDTVALYPNPTNTMVTIANAENAQFTIYDVLGKVILSDTSVSNSHLVNVSNLERGTYFVNIEKEGQSLVKKLIVN